MGLAVVTVAAGGLPVCDVTATTKAGMPVTEAANGYGMAVTQVAATLGMPVAYETIGMVAAVANATWDAASASSVTLSGGNLVAASTVAVDHGCHVAAASGKTAGKYYFELTLTNLVGGGDTGYGIGTPTSTYSGMGGGGVTGDISYPNGNAYAGGAAQGLIGGGTVATGSIIFFAVDLDNRKIWFRNGAGGIWNNNSSNNPTTNVGGFGIPAGTMVPFITFNLSGNVFTANFGASGFAGAVPSGFTAGWPA